MIAAYGFVCAATQMLWLTYAAITTETAKRYGVSVGAVGWLAEIFPLLYVALAIPAGILLDRWFRPALAAGAALTAAGGLVRLGGETFASATTFRSHSVRRASRSAPQAASSGCCWRCCWALRWAPTASSSACSCSRAHWR
jgi:predicted MFS family arabinose efflux permease